MSEDESDSEEDIFSSEESEGDGLQSDDGREQVESVAAAGSATADSPPAAVLEQQVPVQEQAPAGSDSLLTAAALEERANKMFVVGSAAPQASGLPKAGAKATKVLVKLAFAAVNELCDQQGAALSESFGNFDRMVALGWLLGDAVLGAPLLDKSVAHKVGLKARREAGNIKTELAGIRRRQMRIVGKLAPDDPQRQELAEAAEAEEAALLQSAVELLLPAGPAPGVGPASGRRKRKRLAEPTQEQQQARLDHALLKAQKKRKRAEAELARAEASEDELATKALACIEKLEAEEDAAKQSRLLRSCKRAKRLWDAATDWVNAAEADLLEAKVGERDAIIDGYMHDSEILMAQHEELLAENDKLRRMAEKMHTMYSQ